MINLKATEFLKITSHDLKGLKRNIEKALAQLEWNDFHYKPDNESNSIAIIMKHISGNLISRWTNFLTTDGEKPDRKRDSEFIDDFTDKEQLMNIWEKGWECLFNALSSLQPDDLLNTVFIRNEPHTIIKAIIRSHNHLSYHAGQIVFLARHIKKENWKTLSIPRGKSEEFNKEKFEENKFAK